MEKVRSLVALMLVLAIVVAAHTAGARPVPTSSNTGGLDDQKNFMTYGGVGGYAGLGGAGGAAPIYGGVGGLAGFTGPNGGNTIYAGTTFPGGGINSGIGGTVGGGTGGVPGTGVVPFP